MWGTWKTKAMSHPNSKIAPFPPTPSYIGSSVLAMLYGTSIEMRCTIISGHMINVARRIPFPIALGGMNLNRFENTGARMNQKGMPA